MPRLTTLVRCVADMTKKHSNLPERYIKRSMEQVLYKTPRRIQYRQVTQSKKKFRFDIHRPWTPSFALDNIRGIPKRKIFVEPIEEWKFFKGDHVIILEGIDKGKMGIVNYVVQERNWVKVEGLNCKPYFMYEDKKSGYPGLMMLKERPLLVNEEVALLDPSDGKPTDVEWRYTEDGDHVRVSVRTGRIIPIVSKESETVDYKSKSEYAEQVKDTTEPELTRITYQPKLKTFEMDVADIMGIKEDRVPKTTFWYPIAGDYDFKDK